MGNSPAAPRKQRCKCLWPGIREHVILKDRWTLPPLQTHGLFGLTSAIGKTPLIWNIVKYFNRRLLQWKAINYTLLFSVFFLGGGTFFRGPTSRTNSLNYAQNVRCKILSKGRAIRVPDFPVFRRGRVERKVLPVSYEAHTAEFITQTLILAERVKQAITGQEQMSWVSRFFRIFVHALINNLFS